MTLTRFGEKPTAEPGEIIIWNGPLSEIPSGYAICDGNNGTPNLLDRFPRQPADTANIGTTGGVASVTVDSSSMPAHSHSGSTDDAGQHDHTFPTHFTVGGNVDHFDYSVVSSGSTRSTTTNGAHSHTDTTTDATGSSNSVENRPQYHEVAFIMKL